MLIYLIKDNNKYDGPFTVQQVRKMLRERVVDLDQAVLIEGQTDRTYLGQIEEFHDDPQIGQPTPFQNSKPVSASSLRAIKRSELPPEQASKLFPEETVYHFAYIDYKGGGCASASAAKQWILVTNQRVLFEAAVKQAAGSQINFTHQSGSVPMSKVSFVGTSTSQTTEGCTPTTVSNLRINSSGGEIVLAIPTREEAGRIQEVIDVIISAN